MHVYEKLDGISAWLLGFIALRELLGPDHSGLLMKREILVASGPLTIAAAICA